MISTDNAYVVGKTGEGVCRNYLNGYRFLGGMMMCNVFAGQNPEGYKTINRSVRIGGHSTSIQLESAFWDLLDEIAASQGLSTSKFMSTLYDEAIERHGRIANFASLLRTSCVLHLTGARPQASEVEALHAEVA